MESEFITKKVILKNSKGLHARPAALIVKTAKQFKSKIMIEKDNEEVNGKSIMGVLMLAAPAGTELIIKAAGEDALKALDTLSQLVESEMEFS